MSNSDGKPLEVKMESYTRAPGKPPLNLDSMPSRTKCTNKFVPARSNVMLLMQHIKTHGSVSCGPRSRRATPVSILTGRTKTSFSHLCISVITYPIGTKLATELPASQGSLHSKLEENRSSHFRDTSCQSFVFFSSFFFLRLFAHLQKLL